MDELKKFYDGLVTDGYSLPDEKIFRESLTDSENLEKFLDGLRADGYSLPDLATVQRTFKLKKKEEIQEKPPSESLSPAPDSRLYSDLSPERIARKNEIEARLKEISETYTPPPTGRFRFTMPGVQPIEHGTVRVLPEEIQKEKDDLKKEYDDLSQQIRSEYAKVHEDRVDLINKIGRIVAADPAEQRKQLVRRRDLEKELEEIAAQRREIIESRPDVPYDMPRAKGEDVRTLDTRTTEIESEIQRIDFVREALEEKFLYRPFENLTQKHSSLFGFSEEMMKLDETARRNQRANLISGYVEDIEELDNEADDLRDLANKHFFDPERNVAAGFLGMAYGVAGSLGNFLLSTTEGEIFDDPLTSGLRVVTQSGLIPTEAISKRLIRWSEDKARPYLEYGQPFADIQPEFHFSQLGTKDYWVANTGHLMGSVAVFGSLGALAAIPGGIAASAAGLAGFAKIAATGILASSLATPALSAVYAGDAYREVFDGLAGMGLSEERRREEASDAAAKTFRTVLPATFFYNAALFGVAYGSGSLVGKGGWATARNIGGRLTAPIASGLDNYHQEWAKMHFVNSATGKPSVGLFDWMGTPEGAFATTAGMIMSLPHMGVGAFIGGGTSGIMKTPWGEMTMRQFKDYTRNYLITTYAGMGQYGLLEAQAQTDRAIKDGEMTSAEQGEFLNAVSELRDKHELLGEASNIYTHLYRQIRELGEMPVTETTQKKFDEFNAKLNEVLETGNLNPDLQILRQDNKLVPYIRGEEVRVEDLTVAEKEHYDVVTNLSKEITSIAAENIVPSWITVFNGEKVIHESKESFLDTIRQVEDNSEIQFEIIGDNDALKEAHDILAEKFPAESNVNEFVGEKEVAEQEVKPKAEEDAVQKPEVEAEDVKTVDVKKIPDERLLKHTKGAFIDEAGQVYKSSERTDGERTSEHKIMSKNQDLPTIARIGKEVETAEGMAFEVEKISDIEQGELTLDEYNSLMKDAAELDKRGIWVGESPAIGRDREGNIKMRDFSLAEEKTQKQKGDNNYSTENTIRGELLNLLSENDKNYILHQSEIERKQKIEEFTKRGAPIKTKGFLYSLRQRPFSVGVVPKEGFVNLVSEGVKSKDGHFGIVEFSEPLPQKLVDKYELKYEGRSDKEHIQEAKKEIAPEVKVETKEDAVQKREAEKVDVQEQAETRKEVGEEVRGEATEKKVTPAVTPAIPMTVEQDASFKKVGELAETMPDNLAEARETVSKFVEANKKNLTKINPRRIPGLLKQMAEAKSVKEIRAVIPKLQEAISTSQITHTREGVQAEAKKLIKATQKLVAPKVVKDKKAVGRRVVEEATTKQKAELILAMEPRARDTYVSDVQNRIDQGESVPVGDIIAVEFAERLRSSEEAYQIVMGKAKDFSIAERIDALNTINENLEEFRRMDKDWIQQREKIETERRDQRENLIKKAVDGTTKKHRLQKETFTAEAVALLESGETNAEALDHLVFSLRFEVSEQAAAEAHKKLSSFIGETAELFKSKLVEYSGKLPAGQIEHARKGAKEGAVNIFRTFENFDGIIHTLFGRSGAEYAEVFQNTAQRVKDSRTNWEEMNWQAMKLLQKGDKIFPKTLKKGQIGHFEKHVEKKALGVTMVLKEDVKSLGKEEEAIKRRARAISIYETLSYMDIAYLATAIQDPSFIAELNKKFTPESTAKLIMRVEEVMYGETNRVTPEGQKQLQDFVEFQENEFYPFIYDMVNPAYERMYHTPIPQVANKYIPRFVGNKIAQITDLSIEGADAQQRSSVFMSSPHIKRRTGSRDVDALRDAQVVMKNYARSMIDFAAFAEVKRDLALFSRDKRLRESVSRLRGGEKYLRILDGFIEDIPNPRIDVESSNNPWMHLYRNMVVSVLRLPNLGVTATQLGSMPNFVESMTFSDWRKYVPGLQTGTWVFEMTNPVGWKEYFNNFFDSGFTNVRLRKGFESSLINAQKSLITNKILEGLGIEETSIGNKIAAYNKILLDDIGMSNVKIGDIGAFLGGKPIYFRAKKALLKDGLSEAEASRIAMTVVTQAGSLSQQSAYAENRSHFQRRSGWARWFPYMTTRMQYQQKINMAGRNITRLLQRGESPSVEDIDNLWRYAVIQPVIYTGIKALLWGSLFQKFTREEKPIISDDLIGRIGQAMEYGSYLLQGIPLVHDMMNALGREFQDKFTYEFSIGGITRVTDLLEDGFSLLSSMERHPKGGFRKLNAYQQRQLKNILNHATATTGIHPRTVMRWLDLVVGDPFERDPTTAIHSHSGWVSDMWGLREDEALDKMADRAVFDEVEPRYAQWARQYRAYHENDINDRQTIQDINFFLNPSISNARKANYMMTRLEEFPSVGAFEDNFIGEYGRDLGEYHRMAIDPETREEKTVTHNVSPILSKNVIDLFWEKYEKRE